MPPLSSMGFAFGCPMAHRRAIGDPCECNAFNASRYKWVKQRFEPTDVVAAASEGDATVYSMGTLYDAWPEGTPFEGNRYVDRCVARQGKIVQMDVWNDSAERMPLTLDEFEWADGYPCKRPTCAWLVLTAVAD